jgi:hypothetical protein
VRIAIAREGDEHGARAASPAARAIRVAASGASRKTPAANVVDARTSRTALCATRFAGLAFGILQVDGRGVARAAP